MSLATSTSPPAPDPGPFRKDHLPELDGLRGIAVLLVLWVHLPMGALGSGAATARANLLPGNVGVDLFFVLSGFLITRILLVDRGRDVPLRFFLVRRFLRIFPIYYLTILLLLPRLTGAEVVACATYTSNYAFLARPVTSVLEHTWSLAVEEHFYLLWPPVVAFLSPRLSRRVLLLFVLPLGIVSSLGALFLGDWTKDPEWLSDFVGRTSTVRFFSLGLGALIAYHELAVRGRSLRALAAIVLCAALFCAMTLTGAEWLGYDGWLAGIEGTGGDPRNFMRPFYALGMPFASAAAVLLGVAWSGRRTPLGLLLTLPPLRWVGRISYGLYLYHFPIFQSQLWGPSPAVPSVTRTAVALGLCFGVAWLSYLVIERPLLAVGARFRGRAPGAPQVGAPRAGGRPSPARLGAAALLIGAMFWLFNGGARTVVEGASRHDPLPPPGPEAALVRADLAPKERYAIPFIEGLGPRLDGALAGLDPGLVGALEGARWRPFVLGVNAPGTGAGAGVFAAGEPADRFVDLTFLLDVSERGPKVALLVPLTVLAEAHAVAAVRDVELSAEIGAAELRRTLFADALAGAMVKATSGDVAPFEDSAVDATLRAARAAEAALAEQRPRSWRVPETFRRGAPEQRLRWFLVGLRGGGIEDARRALSLPLAEL